jgi:hypothetical protein
MSTSLQLNTPFSGFAPSRLNEAASSQTPYSEFPNLHTRIAITTNSIPDETLRRPVGRILTDLVLLLDYLSLVEDVSREGGTRSVLSVLRAVRAEASSLVAFIENHALTLGGLDEVLHETLDSAAYGIKHEVRRIFETELAGVTSDQTDQETHGLLLDAQGVLTNCFQQCMVNLFRVFDDSLSAARLFHDWQARREHSLLLFKDLSSLIDLVNDTERESLAFIAEQIESFRLGSMRFLMYKDWQAYEALTEPIVASIENGESPIDLLHSFGCYLETLLGQVKGRAVLADSGLEPLCVYDKVGIF